jgi:hypothetical protein
MTDNLMNRESIMNLKSGVGNVVKLHQTWREIRLLHVTKTQSANYPERATARLDQFHSGNDKNWWQELQKLTRTELHAHHLTIHGRPRAHDAPFAMPKARIPR